MHETRAKPPMAPPNHPGNRTLKHKTDEIYEEATPTGSDLASVTADLSELYDEGGRGVGAHLVRAEKSALCDALALLARLPISEAEKNRLAMKLIEGQEGGRMSES